MSFSNTPIPTPTEAAQLRALFAGHPVVALAYAYLQSVGVEHVRDAVTALPRWKRYPEMSAREVTATLAAFVPAPATRCATCHAPIRYVVAGPDPGWWTHTDEARTPGRPHPAVPYYGDDEWTDTGSGPGWPINPGGIR